MSVLFTVAMLQLQFFILVFYEQVKSSEMVRNLSLANQS